MNPLVLAALGIGAYMLLTKKQAGGPAQDYVQPVKPYNPDAPVPEKAPYNIMISVEWTPDAFGPPNYSDGGTLRDEVIRETGFDLTSISREGLQELFEIDSDNVTFAEAIMRVLNSYTQAVQSTGIMV